MTSGLGNQRTPRATTVSVNTCDFDAENLACFLAHFDPEKSGLGEVTAAWKALPADLRKMILGVVKLTANNRQ